MLFLSRFKTECWLINKFKARYQFYLVGYSTYNEDSFGIFNRQYSLMLIKKSFQTAEVVSLDHKHAVFGKSPCCKHRLPMRNRR
jgi:hypothetical protein